MLEFYKRNRNAPITDEGIADAVNAVARELSITPVTARILYNRGYKTPEDARIFIEKRADDLHDPFLMKDIEKGAKRIITALENKEKITIFGDYDVDGVTSVSILYLYLKEHGGDISYYIPSRIGEGYGMSCAAVEKIALTGANLIVTVDTGITAIEEAKQIKKLGMDLIITDHHECYNEIPDAEAVINPRQKDCNYPFKELAGVGVVYKLLCAIEKLLNENDGLIDCVRRISRAYGDLVAIGTIADVMPIKDENRLVVSLGLRLIEECPRLAISELINAINADGLKNRPRKKVTSSTVGFSIAPRINAAGRIRNASIAVELFLSESKEEAAVRANQLCEINRERQAEENKIIEEAYKKIESGFDFDNDKVIVLQDEFWHHGVIGIVASRITEKYRCPSILVSFEGEDNSNLPTDLGKGSGRSVKGLNLVEALTDCSDLLEKYGGHELAAGLTVKRENFDKFKKRINDYARRMISHTSVEDSVPEADMELCETDVNMDTAKELYCLEPFGVSNPVPVFLMREAVITGICEVGAGKHTKITLEKNGVLMNAMFFRHSLADIELYQGDTVDMLFTLDVNEFMGRETVQLLIKDITLTESQLEREIKIREDAASIINCTYELTEEDRKNAYQTVPTRDDFAAVYGFLRREIRMEHDTFTLRALKSLLAENGYEFTYVKLKLIIKIFQELNLINVDEINADCELYRFRYVFVKNKTELEKSNLYRKIKAYYLQGR